MTVTTGKDEAAYAVVALLQRGLLHRSKMVPVMQELGLDAAHVQRALDRWQATNGRPPSNLILHPGSPAPEARRANDEPQPVIATGARGARAYPNRRPNPDTGQPERRCARCHTWYPATAEYFPWKNRAQGQLRSYCSGCWSVRQAETFLTTSQRGALAAAGVEFVIDADSPVVGLCCADCGLPFVAGDHAQAVVDVCHTLCNHPTPVARAALEPAPRELNPGPAS